MTAPKRRKPSEKKFAAAYWEVYRGVLGKESSEILTDMIVPPDQHEPDWEKVDAALRKDFGWLADAIRNKAEKLVAQEEAAREEEESPHSGPTKRLRR